MRWDVRFSEIVPERDTVDTAVRFTYVRRSPVHDVHGTGVSIGERRRPDGSRTSALRFSTADPLSPIRTGRGYWRYVPTEDGRTRFITGYDHASGWGPLDLVVRPLLGWATAWSFDRLRVWLEGGGDADTPIAELRAAVRRVARAEGISIRTGMIDDVLAVVRTDAPLWEAPTSEMRRALAAPDEPGIVA